MDFEIRNFAKRFYNLLLLFFFFFNFFLFVESTVRV